MADIAAVATLSTLIRSGVSGPTAANNTSRRPRMTVFEISTSRSDMLGDMRREESGAHPGERLPHDQEARPKWASIRGEARVSSFRLYRHLSSAAKLILQSPSMDICRCPYDPIKAYVARGGRDHLYRSHSVVDGPH